VLRLGSFVAYACGSTREICGLLRPQRGDAPLVVGPYLEPEQIALLCSAGRGAVTRLPVDVDGALLERMPRTAGTVQSWIESGGVFVYPILLVALAGVVLTLERMWYLLATRRPARLVPELLDLVRQGALSEARDRAVAAAGPTARVALAGIEAHGRSEDEREAAMESALLTEAPRMERSLSLMSALASVAPLLGLLGTVSGMIATFNTIALAGTGNPRLLSGGISEALITTQLGLMVGIPLLLVHAWLARWVERREAMLECDAIQVFGLHHGQKEAA
jgi:biopolymer transport protein ExbB